MQYYRSYKNHLTRLLRQEISKSPVAEHQSCVESALDGEPGRQLRQLVPVHLLRELGAFFSGRELAELAVSLFSKPFNKQSIVLDPSCGAGELLLACTRQLIPSLGMTATQLPEESIKIVSGIIHGRDIISDFVLSAKVRIILAIIDELGTHSSFTDATAAKLCQLFAGFKRGDALSETDIYNQATHIITNPPFGLVNTPADCRWSSGKVNAAALFLDTCVSHALPGAHIVAILPDVLRCGARYEKWRQHIAAKASLRQIEIYGKFDNETEVEVFLIELVKNKRSGRVAWSPPVIKADATIGELFDVTVGPVVDYRDEHTGTFKSFLRVCEAPPWGELRIVSRRRRFSGRLIRPPFVVIRRTSRAEYTYRAVASLVLCDEPLAVENHLLILKPKDNSVQTCRSLMQSLLRKESSDWLNAHIRCRHLPKKLLVEMPLWF